MSDERYNPGFLNEEEHHREQQREKYMVQGLAENRALATEKYISDTKKYPELAPEKSTRERFSL